MPSLPYAHRHVVEGRLACAIWTGNDDNFLAAHATARKVSLRGTAWFTWNRVANMTGLFEALTPKFNTGDPFFTQGRIDGIPVLQQQA